MKARATTPIEIRFWQKVDNTSGSCWPWTASLDKHGYGQLSGKSRFTNKKTMLKAHRLSYEIYTSSYLPHGACVLHTCDNPQCVNPQHLYRGTRADNKKDMIKRGHVLSGDKASWSKLNSLQVLEIRQRLLGGEDQRAIANSYGVCYSNISYIKRNLTWRNI